MQTQNTGIVSLILTCVTFIMPLVRKAMGNHLMSSTSLEKFRVLSLVSATLKIECVMQFFVESRNCFSPFRLVNFEVLLTILMDNSA